MEYNICKQDMHKYLYTHETFWLSMSIHFHLFAKHLGVKVLCSLYKDMKFRCLHVISMETYHKFPCGYNPIAGISLWLALTDCSVCASVTPLALGLSHWRHSEDKVRDKGTAISISTSTSGKKKSATTTITAADSSPNSTWALEYLLAYCI